jgi:murein DD-endopeptidase MepM/ murein hydrolase activator NlpD
MRSTDGDSGPMTYLGVRSRRFTRVLVLLLTGVLVAALSTTAPTDGAAAATTSWVWPLDPPPDVVNGFDPPAQRWDAGHRGVDLAGYAGQRVESAGDGVVSFAGMLGGRGVVTVSHGALRTTYLPVDATVSVGQRVIPGELIGTLAVIGGHCLPRVCLHWGLLRGATYLNPLTLVGAGPIRLLPASGPSTLRRLLMSGPAGGLLDPSSDPSIVTLPDTVFVLP